MACISGRDIEVAVLWCVWVESGSAQQGQRSGCLCRICSGQRVSTVGVDDERPQLVGVGQVSHVGSEQCGRRRRGCRVRSVFVRRVRRYVSEVRVGSLGVRVFVRGRTSAMRAVVHRRSPD